MVTLYVIQSKKNISFRYTGITRNLRERLKRHNKSRSKATRPYAPFQLVYSEECLTYAEARKREKFFKSNISDATVVFVYLVPRVLEKIKPKLLSELKKGTRILSYKYKIKVEHGIKLVKKDLENEMYLYKIT